MRILVCLLLLGVCLFSCDENSKKTELKEISQIVIFDKESVLLEEEFVELEKTLFMFKKNTSHSMVLVTTPNYEDYKNIKEYSIGIGNMLGVGKKDLNDGIIIVFSETMGEVRISVGDGLNQVLTNKVCEEIIDNVMIPDFKKGLIFNGLINGVKHIEDKLK